MWNFKNIWVILVVLLLSSGCDDKKDSFTIKGSLTNIDAPYFFIALEVADSILIDTIQVDKQGAFSYKGYVDTLTFASLYFDKQSLSTSVFLNKNWDVEIKGDANRPDLIRIEGGDVNNDLTAFKKANDGLLRNRLEVLRKIDDAPNTEMLQNYSTELKNINFDLTNNAKDFIEKNPEKIASVVLIQDFFKNNTSVEQLDLMLSFLQGRAENFSLTQELKNYSAKVKLSRVGANAPNFILKSGGKELNISKYKGKYLYLTFATQNGEIYQKSIPAMIEAYNKLKGKNVEFASVIINYTVESTPDSVKWSVFYDPKGWASKSIDLYDVTELPYGVLISPEGRVIDRGMTATMLPDRIKELEKEKSKK